MRMKVKYFHIFPQKCMLQDFYRLSFWWWDNRTYFHEDIRAFIFPQLHLSTGTAFPTRLHVHPSLAQIGLCNHLGWSESEDALDPWLPMECPAKTLIRLHGCAVWSESLLGAHTILQEMLWSSSFHSITGWSMCRSIQRPLRKVQMKRRMKCHPYSWKVTQERALFQLVTKYR